MTIRYFRNPKNLADVRGFDDAVASDLPYIAEIQAQGYTEITGSWPIAKTLLEVQTEALNDIDAHAGAARNRHITTAPGQSETYAAKAADAANFKVAGYPLASLASYPWVQAEAQAINGATPTAAQAQGAADGILAAQASWATAGVKIEHQRRASTLAVQKATTVADVGTALAAAIAALDAL